MQTRKKTVRQLGWSDHVRRRFYYIDGPPAKGNQKDIKAVLYKELK